MGKLRLIRENVPLAPYTTLQIGGPARYFAEVNNESEMFDALEFAEERRQPVFILGGGSNVLIADEGFAGLALRVAIKGVEWGGEVTAGAGEDWDELVRQCVDRGLAGVECLSGIPGLVGATPVQNVGAYGQDVSETIISVRVYDRRENRVSELSNAECRFSYRSSVFNTSARDRYIVLAVTYGLKPGGDPAIRYPEVKNFFAGDPTKTLSPSLKDVRQAVRAIRARKAMLLIPGDPDCRSAGSFFKNPVVAQDVFERIEETARTKSLIRPDERVPSFPANDGGVKVPAAWLIERAGIGKGYRKGRAGVSSKHTLAIVNLGGATAGEVLELVREIQEKVVETFGVDLQPEPVFMGMRTDAKDAGC
jgi:UDP-N-acetylmuramate dehydrogenase